jgi:hypothetical protein
MYRDQFVDRRLRSLVYRNPYVHDYLRQIDSVGEEKKIFFCFYCGLHCQCKEKTDSFFFFFFVWYDKSSWRIYSLFEKQTSKTTKVIKIYSLENTKYFSRSLNIERKQRHVSQYSDTDTEDEVRDIFISDVLG